MRLLLTTFLVALTAQAEITYTVDVSLNEFQNAVTQNGYPTPSVDQYNQFIEQGTNVSAVSSKTELAMFLAQAMWESVGLQYKSDIGCVLTGCPLLYVNAGCDEPGESYYGRGYLQLTWCSNYEAASGDLYGDNRLVIDPDMVALNEDVAWASAFWSWKENVHYNVGVQQGLFGASTRAINATLCDGFHTAIARQRYNVYQKVIPAFGITDAPIESGCYN